MVDTVFPRQRENTMSLSDDLAIMRRHKENGTLEAWSRGTAPILPPEPMPLDPTASSGTISYYTEFLRGD